MKALGKKPTANQHKKQPKIVSLGVTTITKNTQ